MAVTTRPQDPSRNFSFLVSIDGINYDGAFSKVSGLTAETTDIAYREGGDITVDRKIPGKTTFGDITLERGVIDKSDLRDWALSVFNRRLGTSQSESFRRTMNIQLINRSGAPVFTWRVFYAWPKSFEFGDLDGNAEEIFLERLVIANEGWELLTGAGDLDP